MLYLSANLLYIISIYREKSNVDGKDVKMVVKVGDTILFSKYSGSEFKVDGKEFTIIRQSDILAIVE